MDQRIAGTARADKQMGAVDARGIKTRQLPEKDLSLNENESLSRFVAYASPYLFWITVVSLSTGLLLLQ